MGVLCPTSQGANSFMFVHTRDATGISHTTERVFLVPCWCMLMTEKLIKSGRWRSPLVQRMEVSKVWWPSSRWQLSSWVSSLTHSYSSLLHFQFLLSRFPLSVCLSSSSSFFSSLAHSLYSWPVHLLHLSPTAPAETTFSCSGADDGSEEGRAR